MAVFTTIAAVAAVSAAVASVSVATVAAAVVAVSAAVGMMGLAVGAVGLLTGNKDLLKASKIMGYVGLAGGIAGGLTGGVGGMLEGGAGFLEGAKGAYTGAADWMGKAFQDPGGTLSGALFKPDVAASVMGPVYGPVGPNGADFPSPSIAPTNEPTFGSSPKQFLEGSPSTSLTNADAAQTIGGVSPTSGASTPTVDGLAPAAPAPNLGQVAPVQPTQIGAPSEPGVFGIDLNKAIGGTPLQDPSLSMRTANLGPSLDLNAMDKAKSIFDSMPDWMKYSAMTSGLQGISGMAAGYFQGASAEEKLAFEKLLNDQRQASASFAPSLKFQPKYGPAGMVNA